jgi:hypothetical protein
LAKSLSNEKGAENNLFSAPSADPARKTAVAFDGEAPLNGDVRVEAGLLAVRARVEAGLLAVRAEAQRLRTGRRSLERTNVGHVWVELAQPQQLGPWQVSHVAQLDASVPSSAYAAFATATRACTVPTSRHASVSVSNVSTCSASMLSLSFFMTISPND